MNTLLQNRQAMNKRTKEKGAFPDEFFRHRGRKTVCKTPRRPFLGTPVFAAFAHIFWG